MDLTPRLLTEVEFREQWRGYSPNDVDDFLERVSVAVGELQERLREATERATQAERRLLERSDDDEIRRTLVLAQRTAATALEEARAEAAQIVADAHERARSQVAEAEATLASLEADIAERTRVELGELAERRTALQADIDALAAFQEEHRARLRAELQRQLAELEEPRAVDAALAVPEPPEVTDVDLSVPEPAVDIEIEPVPDPEPIDDAFAARPPTEDEVAQAREDLVQALRRAGVDELHSEPVEEAEPEPEAEVEPEVPRLYDAADESGEIALAPAADDSEPGDDLEQVQWREPDAEESAPVTISGDDEDDPFLAELRRAVTDTEPLGPRDHTAMPDHGDDDHDAVPSGRFRLRRGR